MTASACPMLAQAIEVASYLLQREYCIKRLQHDIPCATPCRKTQQQAARTLPLATAVSAALLPASRTVDAHDTQTRTHAHIPRHKQVALLTVQAVHAPAQYKQTGQQGQLANRGSDKVVAAPVVSVYCVFNVWSDLLTPQLNVQPDRFPALGCRLGVKLNCTAFLALFCHPQCPSVFVTAHGCMQST